MSHGWLVLRRQALGGAKQRSQGPNRQRHFHIVHIQLPVESILPRRGTAPLSVALPKGVVRLRISSRLLARFHLIERCYALLNLCYKKKRRLEVANQVVAAMEEASTHYPDRATDGGTACTIFCFARLWRPAVGFQGNDCPRVSYEYEIIDAWADWGGLSANCGLRVLQENATQPLTVC